MDTEWIGGVRLFSGEIPLARASVEADGVFPLAEYQSAMKACESAMWTSRTQGAVTQVVWMPRPGSLLVSTFDGSILQLTQNLLDESPSVAPIADPKPSAGVKGGAKEAGKKPSFSKTLYRHTDAVKHLKLLDQDSGVPYLISSTVSGDLTVLDAATGKISVVTIKKVSYQPCSALSTAQSTIATAFSDSVVHILDAQLNNTSKLLLLKSEDPCITAIGQDSSNLHCAVATLDEHLYLYDLRNSATPLSTTTTQGAIRSISFSEKGDFLATASDAGHVHVSPLTDLNSKVYSFKHADRVTNVKWAQQEVISSSFDGLILRHSIKTQTQTVF